MDIIDHTLSWSYPRWPKAAGTINLHSVRAIGISDHSSAVTVTFTDSQLQKQNIKLVGYGNRLRDYLTAHFPDIVVTYTGDMP